MAEHDQDDKNDQTQEQHRKSFWSRMASVNAGMLGLRDDLKLVPMSHQAIEADRALWFITAAGTHLVDRCEAGEGDALHLVADSSGKIYARVEGRLSLSSDSAKLNELWGPVADSWFEDGRDDPDVRLLKLTLQSAEVWTTTGAAGFLFQLARNKITGATPDMGEHFELTF